MKATKENAKNWNFKNKSSCATPKEKHSSRNAVIQRQ
jgi:hypothetical protein